MCVWVYMSVLNHFCPRDVFLVRTLHKIGCLLLPSHFNSLHQYLGEIFRPPTTPGRFGFFSLSPSLSQHKDWHKSLIPIKSKPKVSFNPSSYPFYFNLPYFPPLFSSIKRVNSQTHPLKLILISRFNDYGFKIHYRSEHDQLRPNLYRHFGNRSPRMRWYHHFQRSHHRLVLLALLCVIGSLYDWRY